MLVRDRAAHEALLAEARAVKPAWYLEEQPAEETSPWRHHLRKRRIYVERQLQHYLGMRNKDKATTLLDLGCGDGNNLTWLEAFAERLFGSDYNMVRLARARARDTGAALFLADILDYPARDGFFEVIFFNHVIEHIPDDRRALETVLRILKPGGLLVLGTPNEGSWWWQIAYNRAPAIRASTDHVHFYTAESIAEKMKEVGFRIAHVEHMGWGPPHFAWDMCLRKYKLLDDAFDAVGKVLAPRQASSLYVLATRPS